MRAEIEAERKRIEAMPDGPEKDAALAALHEKEAALELKESELAALKEYQEHRHEEAVGKASDVLAAMEANGGAVPVDMLDGMSAEQLGDVVHAVEEEVAHMRAEIEAERKRIEAMPDGPEKEAALAALHEKEAALAVKEHELEALKEYQEHRKEETAGKAADVLSEKEAALAALHEKE